MNRLTLETEWGFPGEDTKLMNAIDAYNQAKNNLEKFRRWKALIGKEYYGGTSGKGGEFGRIHSSEFSCEIYHQESDGAKNYHGSNDLPGPCQHMLNLSAAELAQTIINEAERKLVKAVTEAAKKADTIAREIIAAASKP